MTDKNCGLDDAADVASRGLEQLCDVLEHLICLRLEAVRYRTGLRDDWDLAGAEHEISDYLRLGIGADRCGGFVC